MFGKLFGAMLMVACGVITCTAQLDGINVSTNWGESACGGVQLSIGLSTNILIAGSKMTLTARIKNSPSNFIYVVLLNPHTDFAVCLTNDSGKAYKLTPGQDPNIWRRFVHKLDAGEVYECSVPVTVGENIERGDYVLKVTRKVLIPDSTGGNNKDCELVSNLLKVQVK